MYCLSHNSWMCRRRSCAGFYAGQGIAIDVTDGDLVENIGGGIGVDLRTGELELEIAPGFDIPLD